MHYPKLFCYLLASFFIVAFGQPAWIPINGLIASAVGFALFWRVLLEIDSQKGRFWLSTAWFAAVQLLQLSWLISHPYAYIYGIYLLLAVGLGIQFGIIGIYIRSRSIDSIVNLLAIAALWTLFEWSRLFYLSGVSWNPVGLAWSSSLYALQFASVGGVFLLSFWTMLTNLLFLRFWHRCNQTRERQTIVLPCALWIAVLLVPYGYGMAHLSSHQASAAQTPPSEKIAALLVQPAFPIEESSSSTLEQMSDFVTAEWKQLLQLLKKHHKQERIDLVVLPEFVVPFGTYNFVYPLQTVYKHFVEQFGAASLAHLPPLQLPYCATEQAPSGMRLLVNNAFWAQGIANLFQAELLTGLEDIAIGASQQSEYYSAAMLFHPYADVIERYEKRVLVPMGEYIPFEFCAKLAAEYGIVGSFTPGKEAKALPCKQFLISPSICYEETYGNLMREGRQKGAHLLVNLTSDVWFPNSKLPKQHLEHARLRTVENGTPLLRACNTGITAAIDSLGRDIAVLGGERPEAVEWVPDTLRVDVPVYTYATLYSKFGDTLIIAICFILLGLAIGRYVFLVS